MEPISEEDICARLLSDNPWWAEPNYTVPESLSPKRVYFQPFKNLALNFAVRRAAVLLGPRRVGKTYMAKQLIQVAMQSGIRRRYDKNWPLGRMRGVFPMAALNLVFQFQIRSVEKRG